ncbi:MAG: redoxin domain-containing protein [Planctomycetes bacterium]|nr:redoxin domain-containing protein [Planctomycetota bacterium]
MKKRLNVITLTVLAAFAAAATAQTGTTTAPEVKANVGKPAPQFTLEDAAGKTYSLADYKGKIVVLQWINPDCPVCRRCAETGIVKRMQQDVLKLDKNTVFLAINSTHYMKPEVSAPYLKKNKIEAPALIDQDGKIGHLYGARTTPHLFVIDDKGVLRYSGAIDDDRRGKKGRDATNYVVNTVKLIKAGETVAPDRTKPYGCSVKYAGKGGRRRGR